MGALEDALRDTFSERVEFTPAVEDVADRALDRAGRHRRRQAVIGAVAIVVAVVLTSGGALMFTGVGEPTSATGVAGTPSAGPRDVPVVVSASGRPPVDVLIGDSIVTTAGQVVPLDQVVRAELGAATRREPRAAYRAPGSWLVLVAEPAGGEALYRVWPNGSVAYVLKGRSIVVDSDGVRVAWLDGRRVFAAQLDGNGWVGQSSVEVTAGTVPVAFSFKAVLLAGRPGAGGYELWFPVGGWRGAEGAPVRIYGATPGGAVLGLAAVGGTLRLAEYSAKDLALVRLGAILADPHVAETATVSPDGRWLLGRGRDAIGLYDLADAFSRPRVGPSRSWTMEVTGVTWRDATSFVVGGRDRVTLIRADGSTVNETRFTSDRTLAAAVIAPGG